METFTWKAAFGSSKESKARVLKTQYGDGYGARIADGINSIMSSWPVTVKATSLAMADDIEAFLEARAGVEAFSWTPPNAAASVKVVCDTWHRVDRVNSSVITATFQRVFQP